MPTAAPLQGHLMSPLLINLRQSTGFKGSQCGPPIMTLAVIANCAQFYSQGLTQ